MRAREWKVHWFTSWLVGLCCTACAATAPSAQNLTTPKPPGTLAGAYTASAQFPRVFTTQADLNDFAKRINVPDSFSARTFAKLSALVQFHLAARVDWDAVYSGCDVEKYLYGFSFEKPNGHADPQQSAAEFAATLKKPGLAAPAGAAIVAARLALYAALVKAGAKAPAIGPAADRASALAKHILLAWARRGFRDSRGGWLSQAEQFCDALARFIPLTQTTVGLQISRGVIYSVDAQDLLQSMGALNAAEAVELNGFHTAIFELLREAAVFRFTMPEVANRPDRTCERYSNHVAANLMGLLSIARLLDDRRRFEAVLYGNDRSIPVALPWTTYFDHAIYGDNDQPIACYKNPGPNSLTSHPSYQTLTVAPGEIEDRYRNASPAQGFGYPLGVLADFFTMADLLHNAGYDALDYRGTRGQTIERAAQYYACYGKSVGFKKAVTADNARACPDYQQYIGQIVNGLETDVVMGAYHFPDNVAMIELESASKAGAGANLLDPIRFGRWND